MKFIKQAFGEFNFHMNDHECKNRFIIMTFKIGVYCLQSGHIFNENLHRCYRHRQ